MNGDTDSDPDEQRTVEDDDRRNVLKLAGVGAGLTGIVGAGSVSGLAGFGDEEDTGDATETETGTETDNGTDDGDDDVSDHFLADLVDPTFGYALAADETDDVTLEHTVDVTQVEGEGAHPGFPTEDFGEGPGTPGTPGTTAATATRTATGSPGGPGEIPVEFYFDPVGLHVEPDDLVLFPHVQGLHTVSAFHEKFSAAGEAIPNRVPDGVPGFTSPPLVPTESWVYQFTEPGVYDYFCFPHLGLGMVGRVVVFDPETGSLADPVYEVPGDEGLYPNDALVLGAPELDPASIVDAGEVAWADLTIGDEEPPATETGTATGTDTDE